MKAWVVPAYADDKGPTAIEAKSVIIQGSKAEIKAIARFLSSVSRHLDSNDYCHMQLRDNMVGWSNGEHIDIEVNVEKRND